MGISRTGKISNPKSKSPNLKQPRSPKFQKKTRKCTMNCFGDWTSRIRICLGFGAWDLGFPARPTKRLRAAFLHLPFTSHYSREANPPSPKGSGAAGGFPYRGSGGGTGRHVRLRGVCRKACGFESRPEHDFQTETLKRSSVGATQFSVETF